MSMRSAPWAASTRPLRIAESVKVAMLSRYVKSCDRLTYPHEQGWALRQEDAVADVQRSDWNVQIGLVGLSESSQGRQGDHVVTLGELEAITRATGKPPGRQLDERDRCEGRHDRREGSARSSARPVLSEATDPTRNGWTAKEASRSRLSSASR